MRKRTAAQTQPRETAGDRVRRRILDEAERLFAERGFFGTSVRDVTEAAEVRLAAVNYHFQTKEALFRSVLLRRVEDLGADRSRQLAKVPASGTQQKRVRAVVHAFVAPVAARARSGDRGWLSYFALIGQITGSRLWVLALLADQFNRVALEFIDALQAIYPRASQRNVHHAYQFLVSVTVYAFSNNRRLESLTKGALRSDEFEKLSDDAIAFASAGIIALCAPRTPARPQKAATRNAPERRKSG